MPTFDVVISAVVPTYGTVKVEAKDRKEANLIAARIARQGWKDPELPAAADFEPELDAMRDFEVYSVLEATPETETAEPASETPQAA